MSPDSEIDQISRNSLTYILSVLAAIQPIRIIGILNEPGAPTEHLILPVLSTAFVTSMILLCQLTRTSITTILNWIFAYTFYHSFIALFYLGVPDIMTILISIQIIIILLFHQHWKLIAYSATFTLGLLLYPYLNAMNTFPRPNPQLASIGGAVKLVGSFVISGGWLYFLALQRTQMVQALTQKIVSSDPTKKSFRKPKLNKSELEFFSNEVLDFLEKSEDSMNSSLTGTQLVSPLRTFTHKLFKIFSVSLQQSFNEVIATYRIAEAKKLLADPKNQELKILAIAYESGFANKATFISYFKRFTGLTPQQYREQFQNI